jgi:5-methylcytosine-specific restriction enzyme B
MKNSWAPHVYRAAERFIKAALTSDDSLFSPGRAIWSLATIGDLYRRYNGQPDTSSDRFEVKLRRQLGGAPDSTVQLMAEAIFIHFLIVDDITGATKRSLVQQVLSWMQTPVKVPIDLDEVFDRGLASGGLAFKTLRPFQLHFMVEFARLWKGLSGDEQRQALADPWRFKEVLWQVPIQRGYAMREALLHLVFPDTFDDIVAREHKAQIAGAFPHLVSEPSEDVDRRLLQIRERLAKQHGPEFSFYDPDIWPVWNVVATDQKPWDEFLRWGRLFQGWSGFEEDERAYKLRVAEMVRIARQALLAGQDDWTDALRAAFQFKDNNLTRWQAHDAFLKWCADNRYDAEAALRLLWSNSDPLFERLKGFIDRLPGDLLAGSDLLRVMSYLLMGEDPSRFPPLAASMLTKACKLTGYPPPTAGADEARRYRQGLIFLDRLMQEAERRGSPLRDRLEAQSVAWAVAENDPPEEWTNQDKRAFRAWRGDGAAAPPSIEVSEPAPAPTLQQLADELFLPADFLADVLALLRERKQVVIYGPPGTGKTYVARRLIEYLASDESRREKVQFHPSYSYEDFVEGYRPALRNGTMTYELRPGPLRRLATRALQHGDEEHVLLIDEINRGNLPRILGELLYALEYRGEPITPMYGGERLLLPTNLLIIGTMNTADRSIGLIDAALRRRFHFVPMFPGEGPLAELLAQWLDKYRPEMREVADLVDRLNQRLRERVGRHLQLGHSYFLRDDLTQEVLARIWESDVMPFLEDQFFGREDELAEFRLERLRYTSDADNQADGAGGDQMSPHED